MTPSTVESADRVEHPVDVVERLAVLNEWAFDRSEEDEISMIVTGAFAQYEVAFTWLPDVESLHVSCSFDLKVPPRKKNDITELVQMVNGQLWIGHFDLWSRADITVYRHAHCLAGGAMASETQCRSIVEAAVKTCETYYSAFQFVLWAGRSPREALEFATFETVGSA
jgi:hypothetical protein